MRVFMTNFFKVSRGVREECRNASPQKSQNQLCRGIEILNGPNAKMPRFADERTLILMDTMSLRNAMKIVNSFGVLSGLQLGKKKTKDM